MAEVRYADTTHFAVIAGLPPSARDNEAFDSLQGRFFSSAAAEEAILQNDFAKEINPQPQTLIGKELVMRYAQRQPLPEKPGQKRQPQVQVDDASEDDPFGFSVVRREQKLRIVGIIEGEPYGGLRSISRGRVFIPVQLAETLNMMQFSDVRSVPRAQRTYVTLAVRITGPSKVQAAQNAIKQMGFRTFSILDATRSLRRFFAVLDVFLGIFGSLALAVASLAIINTLVMAVLERRREIGIMKAVGASDGDVKSLFFAEAGVMGALGGALGIVLGWGLGRLINFGTNLYLHRRDLPPETIWTLPSWLVVAALVFAVLVSLLAGLYPAARAARLDPIQSLRYE
jgi:putative ABC transport system permease protein